MHTAMMHPQAPLGARTVLLFHYLDRENNTDPKVRDTIHQTIFPSIVEWLLANGINSPSVNLRTIGHLYWQAMEKEWISKAQKETLRAQIRRLSHLLTAQGGAPKFLEGFFHESDCLH
jgi:hypothetical protein